MSPEYVRPYVKAQKNDDRDAEGIAEAATRPTMRFVELKSQDQLDMQTLHRSRDRLVGERTALINQLRAILLERGMVAPQGKRKLEQFLAVLMDERGGAGLSPRMVLLVEDARAQRAELDRRIAAFDAEFVRWAKENEEASRLTTIPGFGPIIASALVAAVGRAESFDHGRDLAAWLGLVPRQFTTGGKPKLLGISKRGNKYLRKQLIHGARAALPHIAERDTPLGRWAKELIAGPIAMSRSSPWPTSWRGSPGRCCSAGNRLTPKRYPWPRRGSFGRSKSAGRASGVCERVTTRWPDSQTALRKPDVENGARRRRVYEDRGARISILAGRRPPRPDTL